MGLSDYPISSAILLAEIIFSTTAIIAIAWDNMTNTAFVSFLVWTILLGILIMIVLVLPENVKMDS